MYKEICLPKLLFLPRAWNKKMQKIGLAICLLCFWGQDYPFIGTSFIFLRNEYCKASINQINT